MAYLVTNAIQEAVALLGRSAYKGTTATGGSNTSFVDSKLGDDYDDEALVNGTCIITRDAGGANAAPEGEMSRISAYSQSIYTGTIDALSGTSGIASGDELMLIKPRYPLTDLRRILNMTLMLLGDIELVYTSITTTASQTEYDLPVALKRADPLFIQIQGKTTDANDNAWQLISPSLYEIVTSAPGTVGQLRFFGQPSSGYALKIVYKGPHPYVYDYDDPIWERWPPRLVTLKFAAELFNWTGMNKHNQDEANRVLEALQEAKSGQIQKTPRASKALDFSN